MFYTCQFAPVLRTCNCFKLTMNYTGCCSVRSAGTDMAGFNQASKTCMPQDCVNALLLGFEIPWTYLDTSTFTCAYLVKAIYRNPVL